MKCPQPEETRGQSWNPEKGAVAIGEGLPTDSATSRKVTGTMTILVVRRTLGDKQAALVVILPHLLMPDSFHKPAKQPPQCSIECPACGTRAGWTKWGIDLEGHAEYPTPLALHSVLVSQTLSLPYHSTRHTDGKNKREPRPGDCCNRTVEEGSTYTHSHFPVSMQELSLQFPVHSVPTHTDEN